MSSPFPEDDLPWEEWVAQAATAFTGDGAPAMDARVDYYLEMLSDLEAQSKHDADVVRLRVAALNLWLDQKNERREKRASWLTHQIEAIAAGYDFGKKRSRDLPHGVFGFRKKAATVEIVDPALAKEWARLKCPEALTKTEGVSLTKTPIVEMVKESRIHLDPSTSGMRYIDERDDFYIKPTKGTP